MFYQEYFFFLVLKPYAAAMYGHLLEKTPPFLSVYVCESRVCVLFCEDIILLGTWNYQNKQRNSWHKIKYTHQIMFATSNICCAAPSLRETHQIGHEGCHSKSKKADVGMQRWYAKGLDWINYEMWLT